MRESRAGYTVENGAFSVRVQGGDFHAGTGNARNTPLQDAPSGPWTATVKLDVSEIDGNSEQAGLVLWASEGPNTFAKLVFNRRTGTGSGEAGWFERVHTVSGNNVGGFPNTGVVEEATGDVWVRASSDGAAEPTITAEYSVDGETWSPLGDPFQMTTDELKFGPTAFGGDTGSWAHFDYFHVEADDCRPDVSLSADPQSGAEPLETELTAELADDVDEAGDLEIEWDFGDGDTATGGATQTHTYSAPGTYRATVTVTDSAGNVSVAHTDVTVGDPQATCGTDEFDGSALDPIWDVLRRFEGGPRLANGALELEIAPGDMIQPNNTARNVVLKDAPAGGWQATAKLNIAEIDANGEQAGLVVWQSEGPPSTDNYFSKIVFVQTTGGDRRFEHIATERGDLAQPINDSWAPAPEELPADADLLIRATSDGAWITAEYSADDGDTWTQIGRSRYFGGEVKVGLKASDNDTVGGTAYFDYFTLACAPEAEVTATPQDGDAPLDVELAATVSDDADDAGDLDLAWDFGDGETASGGTEQSHTYNEPGVYRPALTATDSEGNATVAGDEVIVGDPEQDPCTSDVSDEFTGNALHPKWDILRPMPSGLRVADGALQLQTYPGDLHGTNASARNVLLQDAPNGAWTAATRIDVSDLTQQGDQVGMVLWRSEGPNNFAKVVFNKRDGSNFWFERSNTQNGSTSGGNSGMLQNPPQHVYIRVHSDGGANPELTPEYSLDGESWAAISDAFQVAGEGQLRIGLTYFQGAATRVAEFDWFRLELADDCEPTGACPQAIADDFEGTELGAGWNVLRPAGDGPELADGNLNLQIRSGDFINTTATAENVVMRPAPSGGWTATTEFNIAAIDENGEQAGLVVWQSEGPPSTENVFGKATFIQTNSGARQFELVVTEGGITGFPTSTAGTPAPGDLAPDADVQVRLRSDGRVITADYSADDGETWTKIGRHGTIDGPVQVGMFAIRGGSGQTGGIVPFRSFAIECGPEVNLDATPQDGDAPLEVEFEAAAADDVSAPGELDIEWDFGDGETASGDLSQVHTYTEPGVYEASVAVTDGDGHTTRERVILRVADPSPDTCLFGQSDEFDGNALDPKWDVLRAAPSGLTVENGRLRLKAYSGDMHSNNANARNVLLQDAPTEEHIAETAVDVSDLSATGDQVGLIVWRGEDPNNFAKVVFNRRASGAEGNFWIERANTVDGSAQGTNSGTISGAGVDTVLLRTHSDGAANPTFTAEYSLNGGNTWTPIGDPFQLGGSGDVRIGITYFQGNAMRFAEFDYFRVSQTVCGAPAVTLNADPKKGDAPLEVDFTATVADDVDDLEDLDIQWDFGDGNTASGGLQQTHTYESLGTYEAQISVTDTDENTTTRSVEIEVTEPCAEPAEPEEGFTSLWDGVSQPTESGWTQSGPGEFEVVNDGDGCHLLSKGGLGLLWYSDQQFTDYVLRLEWRAEKDIDNSGVFVRFPDGGANTHQTAIDQGYEVQIREGVQGDGENQKTGSIYNFKRETARNANPNGEWNDYEIRVTGSPPRIQVTLNGVLVNDFQGTVTNRGMAPGYIGLQNHGAIDTISFRNIRIQELEPQDDVAPVTEAALSPAAPDGNDGWYRTPVTVTLDATDAGGSGLESTEYALDGGDFEEYDGPITVSEDGEHVVEFRSTDGSGNVEDTKSVEFKIDRNAPVTTPLLESASEPDENGYSDPVTVTLEGDDGAGSGVAATQYRVLPSGQWLPYEEALEFVAAGEYEIEYRSTDAAGNREAFGAVRFAIRSRVDTGEDLDLTVTPAKLRIRPGKRARFEAALSSGADAPGHRFATLCVKVNKKRFKVIGSRCVDIPSLAAASEVAQRFVLKAKKRARGKRTRVRFTATSPGIRTLSATAVIQVRRR
jgi:PKD repeat protein